MEVTFRSAADRLRMADRRWSVAVDRAEKAISDVRSAVAPFEVADRESTIIDSIHDAIMRRNASAERRARLRDAEAVIALASHARLNRSSPKLASIIQQYERLNEKFINALEQTNAEAKTVLDVISTVSAHQSEIGDERARRLMSIALTTPDVASELLQQEISNARLASAAATHLEHLIGTRTETAQAWIQIAGTADSDVAKAVARLTTSLRRGNTARVTPGGRLAAVLEIHSAMDPLMRVLSQHAFASLRRTINDGCRPGFEEISELLGQSHQALGWTYKEHQLAKRGLATLKGGRTAQDDSAAVTALWRLVAKLLGVKALDPESLAETPAVISDQPSTTETCGAQLTFGVDQRARVPIEEMSMGRMLAVFMSKIAPALVEELVRIYGRRTIDERLTTVRSDGARVVECETVLEFVHRNWSIPMTRAFGAEARHAIDRLRDAALSFNGQRQLFDSEIAREAIAALLTATDRDRDVRVE
jgi:hypothetical protein